MTPVRPATSGGERRERAGPPGTELEGSIGPAERYALDEIHPKVPISEATRRRLSVLAEWAGAGRRMVSPIQIAAQVLEAALTGMQEP